MYIAAALFLLAGMGRISSAFAAPSQSVRINNFIFGVAYIVTAIFTIAAVWTERSMLLIPYLIAEWWMYIAAALFLLAGMGRISSAFAAPSQSVRINNFIFGVAYIVTAIFTIAAVWTERSMLLIPYLIAEILLLAFAVNGLILVLKQLIKEGNNKDMNVVTGFIGGYIFSVLLNLFGLFLGIECFRYLKAKND
uniref:MARVEL domain-containing protein n=1 Tax=Ascaris lumbricoides TaxID=6252 RepID=A0A0M3IDB8_ASCLU